MVLDYSLAGMVTATSTGFDLSTVPVHLASGTTIDPQQPSPKSAAAETGSK